MTLPVSATIQLEMPNQNFLFEHIKANAKYGTDVIRLAEAKGKRVIICGSGPSLAHEHETLKQTLAHQIWAANSALPYLVKHKLPVTHGITVDMSVEMVDDPAEWLETFPVTYLCSSGVHPRLIPHLKAHNRRVRMFHSYLGIKNPEGWVAPDTWKPPQEVRAGVQVDLFRTYEMYLYQHIYPGTVQVGYGLNTVPRAICLALWMEFKEIVVFGADCACAPDAELMPTANDPNYPAWLESLKLYADGRSPAKYGPNAVMSQGIIEGRVWHTRPDMLISAGHIVDLVHRYLNIRLVGDTLPNAMLTLPDGTREDFFQKLPKLNGSGGVEGFGLNIDKPQEAASC